MDNSDRKHEVSQNKPLSHKRIVPYFVAAIHAVCVVLFAVWLAQYLSNSGEVMLMWIWFFIIDFPVCLIILGIAIVTDFVVSQLSFNGTDHWVNVLYAVLFGILGSAQYYWITKKICDIVAQRRERK